MNKPEHVLMVVAIAAFLSGLMSGATLGGFAKRSAAPAPSVASFQAGWDAAKQRLMETGFYGPAMAGMEVRSLSGQVQAVKDGRLTVKIRPLEPLADPALDIRAVAIGPQTRIMASRPKDPAVFMKEMEEYNRKMSEMAPPAPVPGAEAPMPPAEPIVPPSPMVEEEADLSTIKAGDTVSVEADQDIRNERSFAAATVRITRMDNVAPPAPEAMVPPPPLPPLNTNNQ